MLRRHHARAEAAGADQRRPAPGVRRLPGDAAVAFPRRDPRRPDRTGVRPQRPTRRAGRMGATAQPYAARRRRPPKVRAKVATQNFRYEERIRRRRLAPGRKVRHGQFGVGTVLSVEELDDDKKLVVKFASVGTKTLRAKYAKLEFWP